LIDPISDMERTILELDPVRFAMGEKCYGVLVNERYVPQIEDQLLPRCLDDEQLLELLDILRLHPATESEQHLTVCWSLNSEHKSSPAWAVLGDAWPARFWGFCWALASSFTNWQSMLRIDLSNRSTQLPGTGVALNLIARGLTMSRLHARQSDVQD
jgi:hypothetical protein